MTKKLLSLFIISMLMLTVALPISGSAAGFEDVALSSSSKNVVIKDSSVLVTSHPFDEAYSLDSNEVLASLTSNGGYTLSYVDSNGNEYAPSSSEPAQHICDGYIRCTKESEVTDIPVTDRGTVLRPEKASMAGALYGTNVTRVQDVSGIGFKASGSTGGAVVVDNGEIAGLNRLDYTISTLTKDADEDRNATDAKTTLTDEMLTFEANVYVDGNVGFEMRFRYTKALEIDENGYLWYVDEDNSKFTDNIATLLNFNKYAKKGEKIELGRWHRIAVTYDLNTYQMNVWFDGKLLTTRGSQKVTDFDVLDTVRMGPCYRSHSDGVAEFKRTDITGTFAVADVVIYEGYYHPERTTVEVLDTDSETFSINTDTKTITYDTAAYASAAALKRAILENIPEGSRMVFIDENSNEASSVGDAKLCMIETMSDGVKVYDYYLLQKLFEVKNTDFFEDGNGNVGFNATLVSSLENEKSITAVMVISNSDGVVQRVYSSDTVTVSSVTGEKTVTVEPQQISDGESAKVIFIDNWTSRIVVPGCIYNR